MWNWAPGPGVLHRSLYAGGGLNVAASRLRRLVPAGLRRPGQGGAPHCLTDLDRAGAVWRPLVRDRARLRDLACLLGRPVQPEAGPPGGGLWGSPRGHGPLGRRRRIVWLRGRRSSAHIGRRGRRRPGPQRPRPVARVLLATGLDRDVPVRPAAGAEQVRIFRSLHGFGGSLKRIRSASVWSCFVSLDPMVVRSVR